MLKSIPALLFPRIYAQRFYLNDNHWALAKPTLCLSFDVDFPEDVEATPTLLQRLKKYQLKASFACVGIWIKKYPEIHRQILTEGHEILNHSHTHPNMYHAGYAYAAKPEYNKRPFTDLNDLEVAEEIADCHIAAKEILNYSMQGFRVPHFGLYYHPRIYAVLKSLGYRYSSSAHSFRYHNRWAPLCEDDGIWEIPITYCPKHAPASFDSWHFISKKKSRHQKEDLVKEFLYLTQLAEENQSLLNFYFDPREAAKQPIFDEFFRQASLLNKFWVPTYQELIAELEYHGKHS